MTKYKLQSVDTDEIFEDSGWMLDAPNAQRPSLIRAIYEDKQLDIKDLDGLYRFAGWLPVHKTLKGSAAPVTYKSEGLAKELGLKNLYITFNGWWPEKGAKMKTGSFKECEAYSVCGRMPDDEKRILVVASAGNTARAFARVCSENKIPLLLCVPEDNIDALWFDAPIDPCVKLVVAQSGGDYFDAIHLSNLASESDMFIPEGGAKNVARRDGMGTTFLSGTETIGEIPDYYFQAVGSGTGAIAAWESNVRLIEDGRFGNKKSQLMISQNAPFLPIYNAWKADSREMLPYDDDQARKDVETIDAKVLSNRKPPYPIIGGLYDAMKDAGGDVLIATNEESIEAERMFEELEGSDLEKAAAVATATLIKAARENTIDKDKIVMLNITGGGGRRFRNDHEIHMLKPNIVFPLNPDKDDVIAKVEALFK